MNQEIDFQPVLLGSDINVYGMARSFHQEYGVKSVAIGKGILGPCTASKIVTVEVVEPNLEDDQVFVKTLLDFAKRYEGSGKNCCWCPAGTTTSSCWCATRRNCGAPMCSSASARSC